MKKSIYILVFLLLLIACERDNEKLGTAIACFTKSYEGGEIIAPYIAFSNCSENAISYRWDFGDGSSSEEENPIYSYNKVGDYIVKLTAYGESGEDIFIDSVYWVDWIIAYKPNIYIYPQEEIDLFVEITFPFGGSIIESIPEYGSGWHVNVNESGLISNTYDFLFYEAALPDRWQYDEGWCIAKDSLLDFFEMNLNAYNFSTKEINDFTEYWIPLLIGFNYYIIYPQTNITINELIELQFSKPPDNIGRLFYSIIGSNEYKVIPEANV